MVLKECRIRLDGLFVCVSDVKEGEFPCNRAVGLEWHINGAGRDVV
jgi:hypothetical protein